MKIFIPGCLIPKIQVNTENDFLTQAMVLLKYTKGKI